jgi:hypothetical protein
VPTFFPVSENPVHELPEKHTEINGCPRHLQRKYLAHCRKKDKPPDDKDNYRNDQRRKTCLSRMPVHAIRS